MSAHLSVTQHAFLVKRASSQDHRYLRWPRVYRCAGETWASEASHKQIPIRDRTKRPSGFRKGLPDLIRKDGLGLLNKALEGAGETYMSS